MDVAHFLFNLEFAMKRYLLHLILIALLTGSVFSQDPLRFRLTLWLGNDSLKFDKLVLGFDSRASNGIDTLLGEYELPPFVPPSGFGIYGVFVFYDSSAKGIVWSYTDIRPYPQNYEDTIKFLIYTFKESGYKMSFEWRPIGSEFESAWIVDEYLGNLFQVDMKRQTKARVENEFLDRFYVKIKLPNPTIVDNFEDNSFRIFPNPANEFLYIQSKFNEIKFEIIDIFGNSIYFGRANEGINVYNLGSLPSGIYFVRYFDNSRFGMYKLEIIK